MIQKSICSAALALVLSAPAFAQSEPTLTIGVNRISAAVEPGFDVGVHQQKVVTEMYESLAEIDYENPGEIKPMLAESWTRIDGRTMEFKLREGVLFHNGDELTAEDVAFSLGEERAFGEDAPIGPHMRRGFPNIKSVEAVDRYTVRVTMTNDDPVILLRFTTVHYAGIINKRAYQEAASFEEWARNGVGTGPYKLKELLPGDRVVIEAFEDYWGGEPYIQEAEFRVITEVAPRIAALLSGDLDIVTDIPPDQIAVLEDADCCTVHGGAVNNMRWLIFNNVNEPKMDVHLRRALSLGIDRELLVEALFDGRSEIPPYGFQWPTFGDYLLTDEGYPMSTTYDPELAMEELAKSSYNGEPLKWVFMNNYYINEVATAEVMAEMWKAIGINVDLQMVENRALVNEAMSATSHLRNSSMGYNVFPDPAAHAETFGGSGFIQARDWWVNEEIKGYADTLQSSLDFDTRLAAWKEMARVMMWDDPAATALYRNVAFHGARADLDWTPTNDDWPNLELNQITQ